METVENPSKAGGGRREKRRIYDLTCAIDSASPLFLLRLLPVGDGGKSANRRIAFLMLRFDRHERHSERQPHPAGEKRA